MNRLQLVFIVMLLFLAAPSMPVLSHPFQPAKKGKPEWFDLTVGPGGASGQQVYKTRIIEEQILDPDQKEDVLIELEVSFYTGYSFAADADAIARKCRYTLLQVGAPDMRGPNPVITWKLQKKDGKDLLKGRLQKAMKMTLRPHISMMLRFSDKDSMQLESERMKTDPYDDW